MADSAIHRLANGYFYRHPIQGLVVLLIGFGLAGGIAPCAGWLLAGGA